MTVGNFINFLKKLKKAVSSARGSYLRFFLNFCGGSKFLKHFFGKGNCFVAAGAKICGSVISCGNNNRFTTIGAKNFNTLVFVVILKVNSHFENHLSKFILHGQYIISCGGMQEANPPFFRNCGLRPAGR